MSAVYNTVFTAHEISVDPGSCISLSPRLLEGFALGAGLAIILIGCIVALAIFLHDGRKAPAE